MKILIILLSFFYFSLANPLNNLSKSQYKIFYKTWTKAKQFNLQYTLTAIAWQESDFGKYKLNLSDPSCGVFHIGVVTLTKNRWKQARLCERLIKDYDFSFSIALGRFKYFYNYWRSKGYSRQISWKRAICSYNAGFNWKNGIIYYKSVVKKIKYIKHFMYSLD